MVLLSLSNAVSWQCHGKVISCKLSNQTMPCWFKLRNIQSRNYSMNSHRFKYHAFVINNNLVSWPCSQLWSSSQSKSSFFLFILMDGFVFSTGWFAWYLNVYLVFQFHSQIVKITFSIFLLIYFNTYCFL